MRNQHSMVNSTTFGEVQVVEMGLMLIAHEDGVGT